jgi:hypothetical protein
MSGQSSFGQSRYPAILEKIGGSQYKAREDNDTGPTCLQVCRTLKARSEETAAAARSDHTKFERARRKYEVTTEFVQENYKSTGMSTEGAQQTSVVFMRNYLAMKEAESAATQTAKVSRDALGDLDSHRNACLDTFDGSVFGRPCRMTERQPDNSYLYNPEGSRKR